MWKYLYRVLPEILEAAPVVEMVAGEEVTLAAAVLVAGKKSCSRSSDSSCRRAKKIRRSMLVVCSLCFCVYFHSHRFRVGCSRKKQSCSSNSDSRGSLTYSLFGDSCCRKAEKVRRSVLVVLCASVFILTLIDPASDVEIIVPCVENAVLLGGSPFHTD